MLAIMPTLPPTPPSRPSYMYTVPKLEISHTISLHIVAKYALIDTGLQWFYS